jgi:hypothetical protein
LGALQSGGVALSLTPGEYLKQISRTWPDRRDWPVLEIGELSASIVPSETMVRGYKVRTTRKVISEDEANARRQAIAQVIARSLKQLKE